MSEPSYPEHEKLKCLSAQREGAQLLYDYITDELKLVICKFYPGDNNCYGPAHRSPASLIAGALGIDEEKLEAEKVAMLEHQRKLNQENRQSP